MPHRLANVIREFDGGEFQRILSEKNSVRKGFQTTNWLALTSHGLHYYTVLKVMNSSNVPNLSLA